MLDETPLAAVVATMLAYCVPGAAVSYLCLHFGAPGALAVVLGSLAQLIGLIAGTVLCPIDE